MFLLVSSVIAVIAFGAYADGSFGNLEKAFFSMFICITQDGWVTIYKEMKVSVCVSVGGMVWLAVIGLYVSVHVFV